MDENKAYLIEDLKIRIVERKQFLVQVKEPEIHPWKPEQWLEGIELETIQLPLRTIIVNNKRIAFYYNSEVDKFLGSPFDTIKHLENKVEHYEKSMNVLQKQTTKLSNQIIEERKESDVIINQYKELNNELMSKTFWQKLKDLF